MRFAHISRRQLEAMFDGVDVDYDEVLAAQEAVARLDVEMPATAARPASRKVSQGGSKRRIVRLRSVRRSHDPRSTFDGMSDAPEAA